MSFEPRSASKRCRAAGSCAAEGFELHVRFEIMWAESAEKGEAASAFVALKLGFLREFVGCSQWSDGCCGTGTRERVGGCGRDTQMARGWAYWNWGERWGSLLERQWAERQFLIIRAINSRLRSRPQSWCESRVTPIKMAVWLRTYWKRLSFSVHWNVVPKGSTRTKLNTANNASKIVKSWGIIATFYYGNYYSIILYGNLFIKNSK